MPPPLDFLAQKLTPYWLKVPDETYDDNCAIEGVTVPEVKEIEVSCKYMICWDCTGCKMIIIFENKYYLKSFGEEPSEVQGVVNSLGQCQYFLLTQVSKSIFYKILRMPLSSTFDSIILRKESND